MNPKIAEILKVQAELMAEAGRQAAAAAAHEQAERERERAAKVQTCLSFLPEYLREWAMDESESRASRRLAEARRDAQRLADEARAAQSEASDAEERARKAEKKLKVIIYLTHPILNNSSFS